MPKFALSIICLLLGAATPFAFAPYDLWFLLFGLMPAAFLLIARDGPREAFRRGWWFAAGMFLHGISWLYISVHESFGAPQWMGLGSTIGLSLFLAFFYAIPSWLALKLKVNKGLTVAVLLPALWVLFEWFRGWMFTGFPWLAMGYSQIDSPLGGYAPVLGVYGVSLLVLLVAGLCAAFAMAVAKRATATRHYAGLLAVVGTMIGGALLHTIDWTTPDGDTYKVALLQGNVPQHLKWKPQTFSPTLRKYDDLNLQALAAGADLIIWPEVAMPGLYDQRVRIRSMIKGLERVAKQNDISILTGAQSYDYERSLRRNTMWLLDKEGGRQYHKRHLVPFGELFPGGETIRQAARDAGLPVQHLSSGAEDQPMFTFKGKPFNLSICFEDVFGEEVAHDLPDAAFLVNVTNDAWFGDSIEPAQHLQISRMRALETGRYMLRTTQTGITAIIDAKGGVVSQLPQFKTDLLLGDFHSYTGSTPYVIWRNWLMLAMLAALLLVGVVVGRRHVKTASV